ncbi:acylglycerol kinase family protein [Erythrobacter sp. SDW2]|uniref:diacylglycerol/lipid kinase family protein n=1 Tax=Erythrobacter sp. SDW2 TaxID=2907154 RepID=UPI001F26944B|nr:acylglycerol kinase family protein [Erythrobacter sp. SDW2]UIP07234.1 acylglycerol kinase family protein [Erythrobacter sp. SDW2]
MNDPAPVKLSEMPGLPVTGVLYNPRSHRNRDANIVEPDYPVIRVEQPRRRRELKDAMQRFVDSGVELLVINGGDGTVRDALTGGAMVFGDKWPDIAVLPRGKTNALTVDLGMPKHWSLEQAIIAHRDGGRVQRQPMVLAPMDGQELTRLGFILGAGVFLAAIDSGQDAHKFGAFDGLAVGVTAVWGVMQALFGSDTNPWRRGAKARILLGEEMAELDHAPFGDPTTRAMIFLSSLSTFPAGLKPFGDFPGPLRLAVIDHLRRRIVARMPWVMRGYHSPEMEALGLHRRSTDRIELDLGDRFILDGEVFQPGRYCVTPGPMLNFVIP